MGQQSPLITVCGLDCSECAIWRAAQDPALAQELTEQFQARGHANAGPGWFHCSTCRGERSQCWSDNCWIRTCCVDEHGFEHCSECADFPCARLVEWAGKSERYSRALARLQEMAGSKQN